MPVHPDRITTRGASDPAPGSYVLYWMRSAVRTVDNDALEHAITIANEHAVRLAVIFVLDPSYPDALRRHFTFLREGLEDVAESLAERNVKFVVRVGSADDIVPELAADAIELVTERCYLRHQRGQIERIVGRTELPVTEVETSVVIPVEVTSGKREYAARTIRPKVHEHLEEFLASADTVAVDKHSRNLSISGADRQEIDDAISAVARGDEIKTETVRFHGGQTEATATLDRFVAEHLDTYDDNRNQPQTDDVSYMSMYLHFGHISPVTVARRIRESDAPTEVVDSYIEELVVRRELGFNYVHYERDYDSYTALPDWARSTLAEHEGDPRDHSYTRRELERAETHDPYWNAAMVEMRETGYLHNYMRMYWGKKILEWSNTPAYAYRTVLTLNNRYLYDGRDPNSFGNVAWVFGLWDRAWQEREIYGKIRTMTAGGLERKADPESYVAKIETLTGLEVVR